jgi:hypothetical protein
MNRSFISASFKAVSTSSLVRHNPSLQNDEPTPNYLNYFLVPLMSGAFGSDDLTGLLIFVISPLLSQFTSMSKC